MFMRRIKRCIVRSGLPPMRRLEFLNALLVFGRWLKQHPAPAHLETREKLYEHVATLLNGQPFDYLEAGVFQGDSMRAWSKLAAHPDARFFGFDTFEGLPEAWHTGLQTFEPGHFNVGGNAPAIADPRIQFVKGRFQDTLPGFLKTYRRQSNLVVHCDADLYTSTLYFLTMLHPVLIAGGAYLIFDNFSVATHDFRALVDYTSAYALSFEVLATAEVDFEKIAIRIG